MTGHRRAAVAAGVVAVGLLAAGCGGGTGDGREDSGTMVEGDGWRGVLLEAEDGALDSMTLSNGETVDAVSRVPAVADVRRFEELLPATEVFTWPPNGEDEEPETETVELNEDFVRQYTELSGGDQRQLRVLGNCDPSLTPGWEERWISVMDGGSCFWHATMDLGADEITFFTFGGVG
ncbi:hypothetical protein [Streptomyces sp. B6B3]|uniref:hypothetical protein n=1 Tax=Streptomyces sp. B6B3 TaxID=3153570 RepID=UPI00325C97A8